MEAVRQDLTDEQRHSLPADVWRKRWNVQIQPVGKGDTALGYLARYVQKTAISKSTIVASDAQHVTISYIHRDSGQRRCTKLSGQEFLRLFLQHVLPPGFTRVRHFGFLSYAAKKTYADVQAALAERKNVLTEQEPPPSPSASEPALTTEPKPTEPHKHCCPRCNVVMKFGEFWPANKAGRGPPGYVLKPGQSVQCKLVLQFTE